MVSKKRSLPARHNPLVEPEHTPLSEVLVDRRRLGQTSLNVKSGQVGINNATIPDNLGKFDYAHLRVPLPKQLQDSEIHKAVKGGAYPESYFLMRRSSDGYVSATGMFKVAYPWAKLDEEKSEREHHRTVANPGPEEEVAGNIWVKPEIALKLADEYQMRPWIVALLDESPIEKGNKTEEAGDIATPPPFRISDKDKMFPVPDLPATLRKRELRSTSPGKATPSRKIASPRKRRTKAQKPADDAAALENGTVASASVEPTPSVASEAAADDTVTVKVDETTEVVDNVETTHTTVKVKMPASHPDLPLPDTAEGIIEQAREMVEQGRKLEDAKAVNLKRKADEIEEAEEGSSELSQPAKKAKVELEAQLKRERVKGRAMIGIATALAIGAMVPYFI